MDRIKILCSYLERCSVFADVACDHGYCAEYMLKNDLCERVIISDVSEKSLAKAQALLSEFIESGKCTSVCCDGLECISSDIDCVLIAGIGGEEIIKILKNSFIPKNFIFQPMKNANLLRAFLLKCGCYLKTDDIFTDGKNYYFIIKGCTEGRNQNYNSAQLAFGKDSLKNPVLTEYLNAELCKKKSYITQSMTESSRSDLEKSITFIEGVLKNEIDGNIKNS